MSVSNDSARLPDVLRRGNRIDGRKERAGRSVDSAMAYGLLLTISQQDREIAELQRQAAATLLTSTQVAQRLGVSPNSVRSWASAGKLAYVVLPSRERRFTLAAVDELLASCERREVTTP
jgi:excisionase family DNA binding protein